MKGKGPDFCDFETSKTAIMAPSFDALSDHDYDNFENEDQLDFSDLEAQYNIHMEEGLDTFVVIDGLPIVTQEQKPKLVKFVLKKLNTVGKTSEDSFYMPMNDKGSSEG